MKPPRVSVIVATYNWSSVLRYAVASVLRQTVTDFELIVVGDGCTDDSAEVLDSLGDPRLRWENLPANSGHQSAPNNRGLELARGEWIAYLGHDDLWMPNHLELLLAAAEKEQGELAFSLCIVVGAPGCAGRWLFGAFPGGTYVPGAHLAPSTVLHRRSLIERCGNWADYRTIAGSPETELWQRFADNGSKFVSVAEVTVFKFPSSWRPLSYQNKESAEQANFFRRMQEEPSFLHRELITLALAQELLTPHTTLAAAEPENDLWPGATVAHFRQNRGLTGKAPQQGAPRYLPNAALTRMIQELAREEITRRDAARWTVFELIYPVNGHYTGERYTRTLLRKARWTRLLIPLAHPSEGASLRFDPCAEPALIEIAWIALRSGREVWWSLRGASLGQLRTTEETPFVGRSGAAGRWWSRGLDPSFFLPVGIESGPPMVFDCWIRVSRNEEGEGNARPSAGSLTSHETGSRENDPDRS